MMKLSEITNFLGVTNFKSDEPQGMDVPKVLQQDQEDRVVLYICETESRPRQKLLDAKKNRTFVIIGVMVALVLVAIQQFVLIVGVVSIIFVVYMLNQAPVENVKYEISNKGIKYGAIEYPWRKIKYFFVMKREEHEALAVDLTEGLPARLFLMVTPGDTEKVVGIMRGYANYLEEEPVGIFDKALESITKSLNI